MSYFLLNFELNRLKNFLTPIAFFQDFPLMQNAKIKFQVFQDPYEPCNKVLIPMQQYYM